MKLVFDKMCLFSKCYELIFEKQGLQMKLQEAECLMSGQLLISVAYVFCVKYSSSIPQLD